MRWSDGSHLRNGIQILDIHPGLLHEQFDVFIGTQFLSDLLGDVFPRACKFLMAKGVDSCRFIINRFSTRIFESLCNHDGVGPSANVTFKDAFDINFFQMPIDLIPIDGNLGNENTVGFTCDPAAESGMTRVASKNLDDHHPIVGASCGFQFTDKESDTVDGGISTHGVGHQIQVHGLRCMNTLDSMGVKVLNHRTGIISTTDHQGINTEFF